MAQCPSKGQCLDLKCPVSNSEPHPSLNGGVHHEMVKERFDVQCYAPGEFFLLQCLQKGFPCVCFVPGDVVTLVQIPEVCDEADFPAVFFLSGQCWCPLVCVLPFLICQWSDGPCVEMFCDCFLRGLG